MSVLYQFTNHKCISKSIFFFWLCQFSLTYTIQQLARKKLKPYKNFLGRCNTHPPRAQTHIRKANQNVAPPLLLLLLPTDTAATSTHALTGMPAPRPEVAPVGRRSIHAPSSPFFSSLEGGKAPDEDVVGVVPVEHADPNIPRIRPKLTPAPCQDLVLPKKARAVLHILPVAPQPRERCDHRHG